MKKFDIPPPAKLVCGLLYKEERWREQALSDLRTEFGASDLVSEVLPFRYTDYYFEEMGSPLFRVFISFEKLIDPEDLSVIKIFTNALEEKYAGGPEAARVINIDPGYLTAASFILATSKNYAHRIYLGKGVFAQQELIFQKHRTTTMDWTYPDYRSLEYQEIFRKIRNLYLTYAKKSGDSPEQGDSTD